MVKSKRFKKSDSSRYLRKSKSLELKTQGLKKDDFLVFGLKYLDRSQGQTFEDWEVNEILAKALNSVCL